MVLYDALVIILYYKVTEFVSFMVGYLRSLYVFPTWLVDVTALFV